MPEGPTGATWGVYIPQNAYRKNRRTSEIKARRKKERQNRKKSR